MFGQILRQWFWDTYDHLGRLLFLNVLLFMAYGPALWLAAGYVILTIDGLNASGSALMLALGIALGAPALGTPVFAGFLHFGGLVALEKDPPLREFFRGIMLRGGAVFAHLLVAGIAWGVLFINGWFYAYSGALGDATGTLGLALTGLCVWIAAGIAAVLSHSLPAVARGEATSTGAWRLGAVLFLKYPLLTIGTLLFIASLEFLAAYFRFAGTFLFGLALAPMLVNSLRDVVGEMEARERRAVAAGEKDYRRPASWKEIREAEDATEEERLRMARYRRTFRDILKPWADE